MLSKLHFCSRLGVCSTSSPTIYISLSFSDFFIFFFYLLSFSFSSRLHSKKITELDYLGMNYSAHLSYVFMIATGLYIYFHIFLDLLGILLIDFVPLSDFIFSFSLRRI